MDDTDPGRAGSQALDQALGYLNFSAGTPDGQFLANLNKLFAPLDPPTVPDSPPPWRTVVGQLKQRLEQLAESSPTFRDPEQVRHVLRLVEQRVVTDYFDFHRDLLFHQDERSLFNAFMLGRTFEAVLRQGAPWDEDDRISRGAIGLLNDYIGYRPVAVLENRRIEPYAHEWLRPVPLYIRGAGVAAGKYAAVVHEAIELLKSTDEDLLRAASLDPNLIDELAYDPRAYDFDHPANKRPNHHFGQWDPHQMDGQSRYRRFVVQQVTLDALTSRVLGNTELAESERIFEGGAVLAGTILMAAGICGSGPDMHQSNTTLGNLLPHIARYRDEFYERLLRRAPSERAERLRAEAAERQQPFGGARQHLNAELARRRASQLEHVHLAKIYARMGYPEAATRQVNIVPTASARILCQLDCWMAAGRQAVEEGKPADGLELAERTLQLIRRAIECGAVIDPWNILGFDANFSLFPAVENSIHDHRADEMCSLMERLFDLMARVWSEAAARNEEATSKRVALLFRDTANWWHKFATHEVNSVDSIDAEAAYQAAARVAAALKLWHQGGAAAGDVAFWAPHAEMFNSPQAYCLVVDSLLEKHDYVASMALLIHWLGQGERVGLTNGERTYPDLAERWLSSVLGENGGGDEPARTLADHIKRWQLAHKYFDYVEANAEQFWHVPSFRLIEPGAVPRGSKSDNHDNDHDNDDDDEPTDNFWPNEPQPGDEFKSPSDDGIDGSVIDSGSVTHDELLRESRRLNVHLQFLGSLSRLWKTAALSTVRLSRAIAEAASDPAIAKPVCTTQDRIEYLLGWFEHATTNYTQLLQLLESVRDYEIPAPSPNSEAMIEFDQKRFTKESLMEQIVETALETIDARRFILASAIAQLSSDAVDQDSYPPPILRALGSLDAEQRAAEELLAALLRGDDAWARRLWPALTDVLASRPLLYVPLSKGGRPREIVATRLRQRTIQDLLTSLPRLGLYPETCQLIDASREMERSHPVGPGAVTEFDELFKIGYKALIENLVESAVTWHTGSPPKYDRDASQRLLVECLERLTEALLSNWLEHSKTLRLSVLEKVHDQRSWKRLVKFVETYGADIFTQQFLNLANIRSILHQGVNHWLSRLQKEANPDIEWRLLDDVDEPQARNEAVEQLSIILEAIHENYGEYRDYNSTTTQSDRGECVHTLLDFLRLRTRYDRIAWNLKPVVWAHDVLVRRSCNTAAKIWRRALHDRIATQANQFLASLAELQRRYAMRMPTVADRLNERFVRSMVIDRIRALVGPAMREHGTQRGTKAFALLEQEAEVLTREPTGVGLDVPTWLTALEEEVQRGDDPLESVRQRSAFKSIISPRALSWEETRRRLDECDQNKP